MESAGLNPTILDRIARALIIPVRHRALAMTDHEGQTLLHLASILHNLWIARYLLHHRANVNAQDQYGNTPLHYARHQDMRNLLLNHRADISLVNHDGQTPISANIHLWTDEFIQALEAQYK